MKIISISDTHSKHDYLNLPNADVLIHAGDFTNLGSQAETLKFLRWIKSIRNKYDRILVIPGNHDKFIEWNISFSKQIFKEEGIDLLINDSIEYKGNVFYGSPYTSEFGDFAFMYKEKDENKIWDKIPDNTDILITHMPPFLFNKKLDIEDLEFGKLDLYTNISSQALGNKIIELNRIKLHVFGHIHETHGKKQLLGNSEKLGIKNTTFINSAICDNMNNIKYGYELTEVI